MKVGKLTFKEILTWKLGRMSCRFTFELDNPPSYLQMNTILYYSCGDHFGSSGGVELR